MNYNQIYILLISSQMYILKLTKNSFTSQISIILGETSAGKSSLVNLLIREHLLPEQVLSSSSTICQIFNNEQKKAVVIDEKGNEILIDNVTEETLSEYLCASDSEETMQRYKRVDIYWPVPILQVQSKVIQY